MHSQLVSPESSVLQTDLRGMDISTFYYEQVSNICVTIFASQM